MVDGLVFLICLLQHVVSWVEIPFGYLAVLQLWRDVINLKFSITYIQCLTWLCYVDNLLSYITLVNVKYMESKLRQ